MPTLEGFKEDLLRYILFFKILKWKWKFAWRMYTRSVPHEDWVGSYLPFCWENACISFESLADVGLGPNAPGRRGANSHAVQRFLQEYDPIETADEEMSYWTDDGEI